MRIFSLSMLTGASLLWAVSANAIIITNTNDADVLSGAITGTGVTITNAVYSGATDTAAGTFTGGGDLGFDQGIVLTTGVTSCVPGPNNSSSCTGGGTTSSLSFDFTVTSGDVFFDYVFGSEEYNEYVGSQFNDIFSLTLDGTTNIALVPGGGGVVSINNVNNGSNSTFYRDNTGGGLDLQYDGLTTVLTASATGLSIGTHSFEFLIKDQGDSILDSGVFIKASSFSDVKCPDGTAPPCEDDPPPPNGVPEPSIIALFAAGLFGLGFARRRMRS
jgi:hypothetical protein